MFFKACGKLAATQRCQKSAFTNTRIQTATLTSCMNKECVQTPHQCAHVNARKHAHDHTKRLAHARANVKGRRHRVSFSGMPPAVINEQRSVSQLYPRRVPPINYKREVPSQSSLGKDGPDRNVAITSVTAPESMSCSIQLAALPSPLYVAGDCFCNLHSSQSQCCKDAAPNARWHIWAWSAFASLPSKPAV